MRTCEQCGAVMEEVEDTTDYHDPEDPYGHGQFTSHYWQCPICKNIES